MTEKQANNIEGRLPHYHTYNTGWCLCLTSLIGEAQWFEQRVTAAPRLNCVPSKRSCLPIPQDPEFR